MRYFIQLAVLVNLIFPVKGYPQFYLDDFDALWDEVHHASCNKMPLAGEDSEDQKLRFHDFRQASVFLNTVGSYVYKFDQEYLVGMAEVIEKSEHQDLMAIFIMNAVEPFLSGLGYAELKRRYVNVAMENLRCLNGVFGVTDLNSLKNIQVFQEAAVRFLVKSLHSARSMMSEKQKGTASELVQFLGDRIAQGLTEKTFSEVRSRLKDVQTLGLELAQNPFLRSRAAADVKVAKFLEE